MSAGPFQEMSAMEQAVQENRSITKRESIIRLCAAILLALLLLVLLGLHSVGYGGIFGMSWGAGYLYLSSLRSE